MNQDKVTVIDKKGNLIIYDILFTYKDDKNNKDYIVYTDRTLDENGHLKAYGAIYHPENLSLGLEEIKEKKEWKVLITILESI